MILKSICRNASVCLLVTVAFISGASAQTSPQTPDVPPKYEPPKYAYDYDKREVMIPMRDGVKLHTIIVVPKGAKNAPMLLTRTPYNASGRAHRSDSPRMLEALSLSDEVWVKGGYIRVYQDVRGKYGSEGEYYMTRPLRGPLNSSETDHSTDAYDTIEWLVKNVPESNGRVGMIGSSYEGFTVVMALVNPHPALKVAAPESPMVDGWMGDDWFHYGAYRQINLDYITGQTAAHGQGFIPERQGSDDYEAFLRAGSVGDYARAWNMTELPWYRKTEEHPAYDSFWQNQALDKIMAAQPLKVPVLWEQGLWDQEDMWGANHSYLAVEPKDTNNDKNFLVMGPWRHSQINYTGTELGPLKFEGDTALQFRRDVLRPFFDQYLKEGAPKADIAPVLIYNTGENHWDRFKSWPQACETCSTKMKMLYLGAGNTLSWTAPTQKDVKSPAAFDEYVSDPARPVPYQTRPAKFSDGERWHTWLVADQRPFASRPDVLTYVSPVLTEPVRISGAPIVNLMASTSGSDSDWVVKLIDVYPDDVPSQPEMGGYQLAVAMDIFRGRYRESFENPKPIAPNTPLDYKFTLPNANHVFQPGHRIMVQVQSSWFPLYDRNPQTFVPNIFLAKPGDYVKATQRVYHAQGAASFIEMPVVK